MTQPLVGLATPAPASATAPSAGIASAARSFEAMALNELLAPMFDTVDPAHGPFGGGDAEAAWRPLLTREIANQVAAAGGIGLAAPVQDALIQAQENRMRSEG